MSIHVVDVTDVRGCPYCGSLDLRSVPEIVEFSAESKLVALLSLPPCPSLESVMASRGLCRRVLDRAESAITGKTPKWAVRKFHRQAAAWGLLKHFWRTLCHCRRCHSVVLPVSRLHAPEGQMWKFLQFQVRQ